MGKSEMGDLKPERENEKPQIVDWGWKQAAPGAERIEEAGRNQKTEISGQQPEVRVKR